MFTLVALKTYIWKYFTAKIVFLAGTYIFANAQIFSLTNIQKTQKLKSVLWQT